MRKTAIIITFLLFSLALNAKAAVLDAQVISEKIKNDITTQLKQQYKGKVEVEVTSLPYKEIDLPDGELEIVSTIGSNSLGPRSIIRTSIFVDDVKVKTFGIRADIKVYGKVWVTQDWIKRGETLKNLSLEEKEILSISRGLPGEDFQPHKYLARRNIKPGSIINLNHIERIPTIMAKSPVSVMFKSSRVSITVPGIAMTSGSIGDYITVKNKQYKKSYIGKIIGNNLVLVGI